MTAVRTCVCVHVWVMCNSTHFEEKGETLSLASDFCCKICQQASAGVVLSAVWSYHSGEAELVYDSFATTGDAHMDMFYTCALQNMMETLERSDGRIKGTLLFI